MIRLRRIRCHCHRRCNTLRIRPLKVSGMPIVPGRNNNPKHHPQRPIFNKTRKCREKRGRNENENFCIFFYSKVGTILSWESLCLEYLAEQMHKTGGIPKCITTCCCHAQTGKSNYNNHSLGAFSLPEYLSSVRTNDFGFCLHIHTLASY